MLMIADEQRLVCSQPQQRLEMWIEVAGDVLRVGQLHGVVAQQASHDLFIEAFAATFFLRPQPESDLGADLLLKNSGLAPHEIVKVILVAAADDDLHEVEELLTS